MKFVSVDGDFKRVAHTSGVVEMIGAEPIDLPVYDAVTGVGYKGLKECAMAAGCIPYVAPAVVAKPAKAPAAPTLLPDVEPAPTKAKIIIE